MARVGFAETPAGSPTWVPVPRHRLLEQVESTLQTLSLVNHFGFHLADPLEVTYDPEPRQPLMIDLDTCV
jgi:hypothetical protein